MTDIINGPIVPGCFVRLRNGVEVGPVSPLSDIIDTWGVHGLISWDANGFLLTGNEDETDIIEVLPARSAAPVEPSYEQKLWDEAALRMLGGLQPSAEAASKTADAFMAERAKRMKL